MSTPIILTNDAGDILCIQVDTWADAERQAQSWSGWQSVQLIRDGEAVAESRPPVANDVLLVKQVAPSEATSTPAPRPAQPPANVSSLAASLASSLQQALASALPGGSPAGPRPLTPAEEAELQTTALTILGNGRLVQQLESTQPELLRAARAMDLPALAVEMRTFMARQRQERAARDAEIERLNANPFDPAAQARIAELIRQEQINENMANAMEHHAAGFGSVVMLHIPVRVNGVEVVAFVDSGAQMTVMSQRLAEKCNISHLIDTRFAGVAQGVGQSKILGRVHIASIQVGNSHFPSTFSVLESANVDFLLGLDFLKANSAIIDLQADCLRVGDEALSFMSEAELNRAHAEGRMYEQVGSQPKLAASQDEGWEPIPPEAMR